jgi:hypothetical protein
MTGARCSISTLDGDTDGIWVAGNGSKIDDISSCLEQVVCLRDGSMLVQEASSIGERIICDVDYA